MTENTKPQVFAGRLQTALLVTASLLGALYLSWRFMAALDFLYPALYDIADIGAHIDEFGPQNRYKRGFEQTTRQEREMLFAAIATAVRDQGRGLEALIYKDADGREMGVLLRPPEIIHLRDVARLVRWLEIAGLLALAIVSFQIVLLRRRKRRLPRPGGMMARVAVAVGVITVVTVAIGPRDVFYTFHDWVFPEDNQWFFYYQDSLMSTLMKAPFLFGYIAVALAVLAMIFLWLIFWASDWATRRAIAQRIG